MDGLISQGYTLFFTLVALGLEKNRAVDLFKLFVIDVYN